MENKTLVIWIIGSSGVGKTTLARNIHNWIREELKVDSGTWIGCEEYDEEGIKYTLTKFSKYSCNLGNMVKSQCGGCDSLSTKEQIIAAFNMAKQFFPIVILEGIMATGQWGEFLKTKDTLLCLIHLDMSDENNWKRLRQRRTLKKQVKEGEIILEQKTKENLSRKLKGFRSLYNKMKGISDYHISIDVDDIDIEKLSSVVTKKLRNFLMEI